MPTHPEPTLPIASGFWSNVEFLSFAAAQMVDRFAASALTVLLGFQIYTLGNDPLDLALLGFVEVVPAVTLVLYGGDFADRHSRRLVLIVTNMALVALCVLLAIASFVGEGLKGVLLVVAFLAACARAFQSPAATGLEAQVLPVAQMHRGVPFLALTSRVADMLGPVAMGLLWSLAGAVAVYGLLALLFGAAALLVVVGIAARPVQPAPAGEGTLQRIAEGITFVWRNPVLIGSMALDLFAVFFGGAAALFPVFATDILGVGPAGVGTLRAAEAAGALASAAIVTRFMPRANAGRVLFGVVALFGLCMVGFGLSTSFLLSLVLLFVAGLCDGVNVVIRQSIVRLGSPEHLRGRIAAVRMVFVGASNELGAVESGLAAHWLGPARAVWAGGLATLGVVAFVAWRVPALWRLDLGRYGPGAQGASDRSH